MCLARLQNAATTPRISHKTLRNPRRKCSLCERGSLKNDRHKSRVRCHTPTQPGMKRRKSPRFDGWEERKTKKKEETKGGHSSRHRSSFPPRDATAHHTEELEKWNYVAQYSTHSDLFIIKIFNMTSCCMLWAIVMQVWGWETDWNDRTSFPESRCHFPLASL